MNTRHCNLRKPTLLALALSILTTGCALSPLVPWTPPSNPNDDSVTMKYAMDYASSARAAYRARLHEHVQQQGQLSAALLGIGVLATGAAVARLHRDVYTGLALAGGTSYVYGEQNLRPDRLRVYLAGIEALDCAIAVVSPLAMSDKQAKALRDETARLNEAMSVQDGAMANLRVAIAGINPGPQVDAWNAQLIASTALQTAARATANSSVEVEGKVSQGARALIVAVDGVRTALDKAGVETLPSLDAALQAIASLPTLAGRILPGAKLDERIGNAVGATANAAGKAQAAVAGGTLSPDAVAAAQAHNDLVAANRTMAAAAARVNGLLAIVQAATSTTGLSQCKVAGVVAPLSVTRTELRFAGGKEETISFMVRGGVSPYKAALMSSGTGVTVTKPADNDKRFDVKVAASVTSGSFDLLVTDSANGDANSADVTILVGTATTPAAVAAPAAQPVAAPAATATALETFATAIRNVQPFTAVAGHRYSFINNLAAADGGLTTQLKCEPKAGQGVDSESSVRDALVKAVNQVDTYRDLFAAGSKTFKVTSDPAACMKPTT